MEVPGDEFESKIYVKHECWPFSWPSATISLPSRFGASTSRLARRDRSLSSRLSEEFGATRAILEKMAWSAKAWKTFRSPPNQIRWCAILICCNASAETLFADRVNLSITTVRARAGANAGAAARRVLDLRLGAVRELRDAGIAAGVLAMPIVPGITDDRQKIWTLMAKGRAGGRSAMVRRERSASSFGVVAALHGIYRRANIRSCASSYSATCVSAQRDRAG